ncbi:MAG: helix-turn-helix domain-containing protein [Actinomycetota bacterium]|nr:helix-turn-helix domain-containing protein [Actinomycetota bacterium]MDQ6945447.1 helix-turn-helix domain-containing protein [Actinomycetota bacterium]
MPPRLEDNDPSERPLLSLADVARHLDMSVHTVGRWARSGRIRGAIGPDWSWTFRLQDLDTVSIHHIEPGEITSAE